MKKNVLAIIITLVTMYLITAGIMLRNDGDYSTAFNPYWQADL